MSEKRYYATAITSTDRAASELSTEDIMIQEFEVEDGNEMYTGTDILIETSPLADTDAMRDALREAGWWVEGGIDSHTGQSVAKVSR